MEFQVGHLNLIVAGFALGLGLASFAAKHKNWYINFLFAVINIVAAYI